MLHSLCYIKIKKSSVQINSRCIKSSIVTITNKDMNKKMAFLAVDYTV